MLKKCLAIMALGLLSQTVLAHKNDYKKQATATLKDAAGTIVGVAHFSQSKDGVEVKVTAFKLTSGFHGFHVHAVGKCMVDNTVQPPAVFTSAGPHFEIGLDTDHRDHNGDLPVLLANKKGYAEAEFKTDRFKVADLFDTDGSALIVHANPDNFANIPTRYAAAPDATTLSTGDAGSRVACGVIVKGHKK